MESNKQEGQYYVSPAKVLVEKRNYWDENGEIMKLARIRQDAENE